MTTAFENAVASIEGSLLSVAATTCNRLSVVIRTQNSEIRRGLFCLRTGVWLSWTPFEPSSEDCAALKLRY